MAGVYLPPILARDGVKFIGMEHVPPGNTRIVFSSPDDHGHLTLVKVNVLAKGNLTYTYAMFDPDTKTSVYYSGPFGDPTKDELVSVDGFAI